MTPRPRDTLPRSRCLAGPALLFRPVMNEASIFAGTSLPAVHRAVMDDHARLPWRFFARLMAAADRGVDRL